MSRRLFIGMLLFISVFIFSFSHDEYDTRIKDEKGQLIIGDAWYETFRMTWGSIDNLNELLLKYGYPEFDDRMLLATGATHGYKDVEIFGEKRKIRYEAELGIHCSGDLEKNVMVKNTNGTTENIKIKQSLNTDIVLTKMGYDVLDMNYLKFYPFVGFGVSRMDLNIGESGEATIEELIKNPRREIIISRDLVLAGTGAGVDLYIPFKSTKKYLGQHVKGWYLGFQGGYTYSWDFWELYKTVTESPVNIFGIPKPKDYRSFSKKIKHGPDIDMTGPYIKNFNGNL